VPDAATSSLFPFLSPGLLGPAAASAPSLHPLLGVPIHRSPADLLAQQYLSALAAAAAAAVAGPVPVSASASSSMHIGDPLASARSVPSS